MLGVWLGIFHFVFLLSGRVPDTADKTDRDETHDHVSTLIGMCSFSLDTHSNGRSIVEVREIP
jgi:hypothetical protein